MTQNETSIHHKWALLRFGIVGGLLVEPPDKGELQARIQELADDYREVVRAHTAELERRFTAHGIDYTLLNTSKPLDHALFRYLTLREKLSRVR